jgi:hypothetical protein
MSDWYTIYEISLMVPSRDFQFVNSNGSSIQFAVWNHLRNKRQLEILIKVIV